jgi:glycosyltransferase involved in cell wall biosynthesis
MNNKFICVHLGARSHYLIPRAMELYGALAMLITDTWIPSSWLRALLVKLPIRQLKSLSNRYSNAIINRHVSAFSFKFLLIELYLRLVCQKGWGQIIYRNQHFQQVAIKKLKKLPASYTVFGFSYTSLEILKLAKERGQKTVLFQVDPGYKEEEIVSEVVRQNQREYPTTWELAPASYWLHWQRECDLADCIMVNSEWSKENLIEYGISPGKIKIIALPFKMEGKHLNYRKCLPKSITKNRPLRCLFLGTLSLRKGIHYVLQAAALLRDYPVEFILVGRSELYEASLQLSNVIYKGVATRAETDLYYQQADLFLFPTLSDGFGLTQLEAMAWQLPVVASSYCGKVVEHQFNGLELANCSGETLAESILYFIHNPVHLQAFSSNCISTVKQYSIDKFARELAGLL